MLQICHPTHCIVNYVAPACSVSEVYSEIEVEAEAVVAAEVEQKLHLFIIRVGASVALVARQ